MVDIPSGDAVAAAAREAEVLGKPPRIPALDRHADADAIVEAAHRLRTGMFGEVSRLTIDQVPEIMVTMAPFGTLWERMMGLSIELMGSNSRLSKRDQKLAILRTGWLLQAPYEFGEHVRQARTLGFSEEEVERIASHGSAAPEWSEHERAILQAAEELRENVYVSDATWDVLARTLDQHQLFELLILIGQFTTVAYFQNSLRLKLDAGNEGLRAR